MAGLARGPEGEHGLRTRLETGLAQNTSGSRAPPPNSRAVWSAPPSAR
ncbi:hypothetical protein [Streptomyces sp. NPDC089919]